LLIADFFPCSSPICSGVELLDHSIRTTSFAPSGEARLQDDGGGEDVASSPRSGKDRGAGRRGHGDTREQDGRPVLPECPRKAVTQAQRLDSATAQTGKELAILQSSGGVWDGNGAVACSCLLGLLSCTKGLQNITQFDLEAMNLQLAKSYQKLKQESWL
jgi:hypothetical protein